ncbi:imidazolonepropionase [Aestuariispira insulae]|uniref:Imidazolonepropionase n=1 Tax=Aestuariispira insulae TaxID=1461337 RepID=A0A3D9HX35_9PROT|nr:imidazolonepropionase [Aestuariispira insulae]RED53979.1 imidazolonepropionase [Aestuariispira insulae]
MWDTIWINGKLATMDARHMANGDGYGAIPDGAIAIEGDRIAWVGRMRELPDRPEALATHVRDAGGRWITPGLVDCHTHLVYGGNRAKEFELRLTGASYEEIARAGGGIVSTVQATRAASEQELLESASVRLERLMEEGVTTVEIKSGYGLDTETECKMLRVARKLADQHSITIRTTFLGAHALPPEFKDRPDEYIDLVCSEMLPKVAEQGLADAVDAFCEGIGFTPAQTEKVFQAAERYSLPVKLHADQLSDLDGAALAAKHNGLSADHLEYTNEKAVKAMARAGTVAVLLPGAFYFLRETKMPPMEAFREHGVPIALATDSNPGSAPVTSLLLMMNMACTLFRMTPAEALAGITIHGARALGLADRVGSLTVGKRADFVLWDIEEPAELAYRIGHNPCAGVIRSGHIAR